MAATIYPIFLLVLSVLAHWTPILVVGDEASECVADLATLTTALSNADAGVAAAQQAKVTAQQALDARNTFCSFTCPAGFTKVPGVHKCIKLVNEEMGWNAARDRCAVLQPGSYLASFDSQAEWTFLLEQIAAFTISVGAPTRGYWLGGRRVTDACASALEWKTVVGGPTRPITFAYSAIDNSCPIYPTQFCLELTKVYQYGLNDMACDVYSRPICQYP